MDFALWDSVFSGRAYLLPLLCALASLAGETQLFAQQQGAREFAPGQRRLADFPPGRFRVQLERLPAQARDRALAWLGNVHFTAQDLDHLRVDGAGGVFYVDEFPLPAEPQAAAEPQISEAAVAISPFPNHLVFHSKPGAPNVLYINFCGENVTGTAWNSDARTTIPAVAFSTDSDLSTFSDAEQAAIKRIWQRVAEDYAPFNIDVTTERPSSFNARTAHLLVTRNTDANGVANPASTAGGVAYVNVFGTSSYATYRPAWVYCNNLGSDESYISEAASHEVGHNLGLSHDGKTDGSDYYGGHGSGDTSWGPLMGVGYNRNVSQWSKGEYHLGNNTQDDLATIAAKISYKADDHGNTASSATALTVVNGTNILSTTPQNDPANTNIVNKGFLERNNDVDVFSFVTGNGLVSLTANPWVNPAGTRGGNVDLVLELYDSSGQLVLTNNAGDRTFARIETTLSEGVYYLSVKNTGAGAPNSTTPSGYTAYGSIGQYFISGSVVSSSSIIPPGGDLAVSDLTHTGAQSHEFTVTYSDNVAINVSTIDNGDIIITGPNGYSKAARLMGVDISSNGTPRIATYAADAPNLVSWSPSDNGMYTVAILSNQVADTEGAFVAEQELGTFNVSLPNSIYFEPMDSNPGWTFQSQWQFGVPNYGSSGPSSGYTGSNIIGFNLSGDYPNNLSRVYATTPAINCAGASSLALKFRRWLRLRNSDTALIQVSTNDGPWTTLWSTTRAVSDASWQEIQYSLPSWTAGTSALRLRWGISSGGSQNDIGWNIDDVEILGDGGLDVTPPTAVLSVANLVSGGAVSHSFSVTYTDNIAVSVASLGSSNLLVSGPNGYSQLADFTGVDNLPDGSPRTAVYSLAAPGALWDDSDNGTYSVALQANEVSDTSGNEIPAANLGSFTVAIPSRPQALIVSTSSMNVVEGSNALFTIRLAEPPSSSVEVNISRVNGDSGLVIESGASHVFTSVNWSNPAPVVISALPDSDQQNGSATFECRADNIPSVNVLATESDVTPNNTLTISVNNASWGIVQPEDSNYPVGSIVQVTATPLNSRYRFVQWTGDFTSTDNPISVVMDTNIFLQAIFEKIDTNPPVASLDLQSIHSTDLTNYVFSILYEDTYGVRLRSLSSSNLLVLGPAGFSNEAEMAGAVQTEDSTSLQANYGISLPLEPGEYQIYLLSNQVYDTSDNAAAGGLLGSFNVSFPPQALIVEPLELLIGEGSNATLTVRLAHRPTSNVTVTVTRFSGDSDLVVTSSDSIQFDASAWSNAVPLTISGLADRDQQSGQAEFNISAPGLSSILVTATEFDNTSDNVLSVTVNNSLWGSVAPLSNNYPVDATVEVTATPASPLYRFVQWTGSYNSTVNPLSVLMDSNVTIQAEFEKIDSEAPTAFLDPETITNSFLTNISFNVFYSDNSGINTNSISSSNLVVIGPTGETNFVSLASLDTNTTVAALYNVTLSVEGEHQVILLPDQVYDTAENPAAGAILGSFILSLPPSLSLVVELGENDRGTVNITNAFYRANQEVTLIAEPAPYYKFAGWTGDLTSTNNPLTFQIVSNITLRPTFVEELTPVYSVPHIWLASHGFTNDLADAETIMGVNGIPLWQSYVAGLNPNDPTSQLKLTIQRVNGKTVLSWPSIEGRVYSISASTNAQGPYDPLSTLPAHAASLTTEPSNTLIFYRLEVTLEDRD